MDDTFLLIFAFVLFVFGILQIILFFKLWGMTNDVWRIRVLLENKQNEKSVGNEKTTSSVKYNTKEGWGENLTELEINQAKSLIGKIYANELIVKDLKKDKVFVWDKETWHQNKHQTDKYKLIYSK